MKPFQPLLLSVLLMKAWRMTTHLLSWSRVVPGHPQLAGSVESQCPGSLQVSFPGNPLAQLPRGSEPGLLPLLSKVTCQVNDHYSKTMAEMNPRETTNILVLEMEQASLSPDSAREWSCHSQQSQPLWPSVTSLVEKEAGAIIFLHSLSLI